MAPKKAKTASKTAKAPAAKPSGKKSVGKKAAGSGAAATKLLKKGEGKQDDVDSSSSPPPQEKKTLTSEEASAIVQRCGRGFSDRLYCGSRFLKKLRSKMEEQMEDRISKASKFMRKRDQKTAAIRSDTQSKEEKKIKLQEDLCVAAFDGEIATIKKLVKDGAQVNGKDQQGNFPIGEAAVNGQSEAIKVLADMGGDPNCKGQFGRTPLWRASFNSHADAIQTLLELGGDPRVTAQGDLPVEMGNDETKKILTDWDPKKTDSLLAGIQKRLDMEEAERKKEAEKVSEALEGDVETSKVKLDTLRKKILHAKCECEKRIVEYDLVNDGTKDPKLVDVALQCVKDAEALIDELQPEVDEAEHEYLNARASLAEHNHAELGEDLVGVEVPFKMIQDTIVQDSDNQWRKAKKWPLIIDVSGRSGTYLKYRDTNYLDSMFPHQMEPEIIRHAILGALKYGKPLVVDLRDVPMLDSVIGFFNAVRDDLWDDIVSHKICDKSVFLNLVKPEVDEERYEERHFNSSRLEEFCVLLLTSSVIVEGDLAEKFYPYRVEVD